VKRRPGRGRFEPILRQAPAFAVAALLQAALLFHLLLTEVPARVVPLGQRLAVAAAILSLAAVEAGLATVLNAAVEAVARRCRPGLWLDPLKAAGLATLLGLSAASVVKYRATGVHLKRSDLWFGWHNRRQILQEALAGETRALVLFATATAVTGCLLLILLWRTRRRPARIGAAVIAAVTLAAALTGTLLYRASPTVQRFARQLTPEGRWLASRSAGRFRAAVAARGGGAGHSGPAIVPYAPAAAPDRPNLLLIMLESVPWKRTPFAEGPAGLTPHLESLAAESVLFRRAYTTSGHSDYAQMATLSSLHPRKFDRHDYDARIAYPRTLIWDALAAAGYATAMFSCQNERWGNMLGYLDTPGLDLLRHSLDWPAARRRGRGPESKVFEETPVAAWKSWRRTLSRRPWFTYLNFQANHFPYEVPPEAPRPFAPWRIDFPASFFNYPPAKAPLFVNRFNNALAYSDAWIGEVRAELERSGEWRHTALAVVSDHGEAFYEHGHPTHGTALHEEQVRSLMLVRLPGTAPRAVDEPVGLLDLAPALLAALGLPPHGNFQGRGDVLEPGYSGAGRPFFFTIQGMTSEDGVLRDGWKYLYNLDSGQARLYDLATDPGETTDVSTGEPQRAAELDAVLRSFLASQLGYYAERGWEDGHYPPPLP
jgi:lipoteichoic acid synthase